MFCWLNPERSASRSSVRPFCCLIRFEVSPAEALGGGLPDLLFRPATTPKWLRRRLAWGRHDEELYDRGAKGIRKLLEQRDGWVFQPTFEAAYVGSIDIGVGGESLLRQVALDPKSPEIPRHKCLRPHAERRTSCGTLNHGL